MSQARHGQRGEAAVGSAWGFLETEIETYEREREQMLKTYPNKWVVIRGRSIVGYYATRKAALAAGRKGCGPFLAHRIVEKEPVYAIPTFDLLDD